MRLSVGSFFLLAILFLPFLGKSQHFFDGFEHLFTAPKSYVIHHTVNDLVIDGRADELSWQKIIWSDEFKDIEGDRKAEPLYSTRIKMLWDEEALYLYAELEEPHVWAYYDKHDMIVYHENDFEVFIDPERDAHNYYEFEVNARNTLFDLFMGTPYRNGGHAAIDWDATGFASKVFVDGTLNNPDDRDKKWCVEMRIPFSSLTTDGNYIRPKGGDFWKVNFSRVQWQTQVKDGKYIKTINPETGKNYPENNWVWSPQGLINMHFPERWGLAFFSATPAGAKVDVQFPQDEILSRYLWLIYYKQARYKQEHQKYAVSPEELNLPARYAESGISFSIRIKTSKDKYTATLESENGIVLSINQKGHFINQQKNRK